MTIGHLIPARAAALAAVRRSATGPRQGHVVFVEQISISKFKATCLAMLERIRQTREPILVIRCGLPVAEIKLPPEEHAGSWLGTMAGIINIVGDIVTSPAEPEDTSDGEKLPLARELVRCSGVKARTILTRRVPQSKAPGYLAAADMYSSPSVPNPDDTPFFGSSTKLFEYMPMGRAIVASNLDQNDEILTDEEAALRVPPADPDLLANGIGVLARDAGLRRRLGTNARERCLADFTLEQHTCHLSMRCVVSPLARRRPQRLVKDDNAAPFY